jgi:hypothetical protein
VGFCLFIGDSEIVEDLLVDMVCFSHNTVHLSDGQILIITEWLDQTREPTEELNAISYVAASNDETEMLINLSCAGARTH